MSHNKRRLQTTSCQYICKLDDMDKFLKKKKKSKLTHTKQNLYSLITIKTFTLWLKTSQKENSRPRGLSLVNLIKYIRNKYQPSRYSQKIEKGNTSKFVSLRIAYS